jgi:uridine kinase
MHSRLDRRPGEAERFPAPFLDALTARIAAIQPKGAAALVAIDGWGCGGKTALAEGLLDRLEPAVQYLSTDEFFTGFDAQTDPGPAQHLRWAELRAAVSGLSAQGAAQVRGYDWEQAVILPPQPLAGRAWLVEGLFSLHADLTPVYDLTIWVHGRLDGRLSRVARRDGAHMLPHWERDWMPRESAYILAARPWERADLVIAGADLSLSEMAAEIRALG